MVWFVLMVFVGSLLLPLVLVASGPEAARRSDDWYREHDNDGGFWDE